MSFQNIYQMQPHYNILFYNSHPTGMARASTAYIIVLPLYWESLEHHYKAVLL